MPTITLTHEEVHRLQRALRVAIALADDRVGLAHDAWAADPRHEAYDEVEHASRSLWLLTTVAQKLRAAQEGE